MIIHFIFKMWIYVHQNMFDKKILNIYICIVTSSEQSYLSDQVNHTPLFPTHTCKYT